MAVRAYAVCDAESISQLYRSSILGIGPKHYSTEQVAAWASRTPDAAAVHARAGDGRRTLVAVDDTGKLLGFIDLEADGHIDFFYCAPDTTGTGASAELYDAVESAARADGMARLYSEASEAAVRFFRRRGFAVLQRRDLKIGEVVIHNFAVEKRLD